MGQAVSSFSIFLPKFTDVRQSDPGNDTMRKDVRLGEIGAAAVAIGVGVILSSMSGHAAPAIVAVLMSAIIIALYEKALGSKP